MARSGSLLAYFVTRILLAVPMLFILLTAVFIVLRILPGDPVLALWGQNPPPAAVEAARRQANAGVPLLRGPTPAETWALRTAISPAERLQFQVTVDRHRYQVRTQEHLHMKDLNHWEDSAVDRQAIQRALVEHGYLLFRRRRIPLEITGQNAANI